MASAETLSLVGGLRGERNTSMHQEKANISHLSILFFKIKEKNIPKNMRGTNMCFAFATDNLPLLPGTLTIYNSNGSSFFCVGFRGYDGGFDAMPVIDDSERASTGP